jgi:hypothetical protein
VERKCKKQEEQKQKERAQEAHMGTRGGTRQSPVRQMPGNMGRSGERGGPEAGGHALKTMIKNVF